MASTDIFDPHLPPFGIGLEEKTRVDWEAVIASGGGPSLALGAERRLAAVPGRDAQSRSASSASMKDCNAR